jgi:hypothetical protein
VGGRIDPQTVSENVRKWRKEHGLPKKAKFTNPPKILKLSKKNVVIAIDQQTGEAVV